MIEDPLEDVLADALQRLFNKFHHETDCGQDGLHWAECERASEALHEFELRGPNPIRVRLIWPPDSE